MKTNFIKLIALFTAITVFTSCSKDDDSSSENTAPNWASGTVYTVSDLSAGDASTWDLTDKIADAQKDTWEITEITSSNTAVIDVALTGKKADAVKATASVFAEGSKLIYYTATGAGTAMITLKVKDSAGNTRSLTFNVTVKAIVKIEVPATPASPVVVK